MAWTDPRIERKKAREEQVRVAGTFGETFYGDAGETHSYAALAPAALEAQPQLELKLDGLSKRHVIRQQLAEQMRGLVDRRYARLGEFDCYIGELAHKLANARLSGTLGYQVSTGKMLMMWDDKAGLSRFCPDDAREEAMRQNRKVLEPMLELQKSGHSLHYIVFTVPNAVPGQLREGNASILRRFKQLLKAKHKEGPLKGELKFPEIKGALCVLESPLGGYRDWNVHLNVILVVKGYLDYKALRKWWHWDFDGHMLKQGHDEELNRQTLRQALAELIKYAVAATVSKSAEKAASNAQEKTSDRSGSVLGRPPGACGCADCRRANGSLSLDEAGTGSVVGAPIPEPCGERRDKRPSAPPMLEWTDAELYEFIYAMKGFRRTRSYGVLYKLKKPAREELGTVIHIGTVTARGRRMVARIPLLESIPGDNFSGMSGAERWRALLRMLNPAGLAGAGALGESLPRMSELSIS